MGAQALEGVLDIIDTLTKSEIQKLIRGFEARDSNNQYEEFCFVLVYFLKKYSEY